MLHVHVLLVAPLGTGNMPQPGADQHQRRVPIRETADHPGPSPDFPIQSLNHIVRSDLCPMLRREVTIGQRFFEAVLHFFRRFLELHRFKLCHNSTSFFSRGFLALLRMDRF